MGAGPPCTILHSYNIAYLLVTNKHNNNCCTILLIELIQLYAKKGLQKKKKKIG